MLQGGDPALGGGFLLRGLEGVLVLRAVEAADVDFREAEGGAEEGIVRELCLRCGGHQRAHLGGRNKTK